MIAKIEDFFTQGCGRCDRFATPECSALRWSAGIAELRRICLSMGLAETLKWGHPCYMHAGRNIVLIGAQREDLRLNFFKAALMTDPAALLVKQGPNTQHADSIQFKSVEQITAVEATVRSYIAEAMGYAEGGVLPPRTLHALVLPQELVEALEADAELARGFDALTPGRQRSYVLVLSGLKKAESRISRIAKLRGQILAGKGAQER
jgi:uncharacterized protein YdeI (YjbR/CyaY-like superfamily)